MKMQATDCKEIFSTPYLIKDLYPKYVKKKKKDSTRSRVKNMVKRKLLT